MEWIVLNVGEPNIGPGVRGWREPWRMSDTLGSIEGDSATGSDTGGGDATEGAM